MKVESCPKDQGAASSLVQSYWPCSAGLTALGAGHKCSVKSSVCRKVVEGGAGRGKIWMYLRTVLLRTGYEVLARLATRRETP
jgi:hypothetical protein